MWGRWSWTMSKEEEKQRVCWKQVGEKPCRIGQSKLHCPKLPRPFSIFTRPAILSAMANAPWTILSSKKQGCLSTCTTERLGRTLVITLLLIFALHFAQQPTPTTCPFPDGRHTNGGLDKHSPWDFASFPRLTLYWRTSTLSSS